MRRTTALAALFPLAVGLAACGDDGGGSLDAFCEAAEEVAGESEPSVGQIEDMVDAAPDEIGEEMELLLEFFEAAEGAESEEDFASLEEDFDEEELDDAADTVADFAREECDVDLEDTADGGDGDEGEDDETTTTEADDEETTTTEAEDDGGDGGDGGLGVPEAGDPEEPPSIDDPELAALAEECFEGSGSACDELFFRTDVGSPEEEYGNTCGGRFDESPGFCEQVIGE